MVDGKKNNKTSLHMRNLAPDTVYLWHVHEGTCAATGAPVAGWTYRMQVGANGTLTSDASGNANTKGKSATSTPIRPRATRSTCTCRRSRTA